MDGIIASLRRKYVSEPILAWYRRILPPLSDTEREALEAGTIWWDAELFSGRPDWRRLRSLPKPRLAPEEEAFLDGPVEELCRLLDDWEINFERRDLPPEIWRFIKDKGFLGLVIPKAYGGLGFSALAHSAVVMKIAARSLTAAVTVMVPNSLGPAELLERYGTEAQKNRYLPRLARGDEIPCFALTGPTAGSDAASIPDRGTVCYGEFGGARVLGMRISWEKRYITLGPVATLMGLAFRLHDPDRLLGETEDLGITLALVPTDTPGVRIGRRHYPAGQAFQNGPTAGRDVFLPLDSVIGDRDGIGQGWRMLMECLAAGRAISLPAVGCGGAKLCARTAGAYARVRRQFRVPIGRFEGVREALARIAGHSYVLDAARRVTAVAIDQGERPAVLSAILKYHATARLREVVNDAVDLHGGKAICDGPRNYLANIHSALPVAITVEGANILTRSMIIFGQGAVRCHPYLLKEMRAARDPTRSTAVAEFDRVLFAHLGHALRVLGRAFFHGLTAGRWAEVPQGVAPVAAEYYRRLGAASAAFALVSEATLALLGGRLKRREMLSARLGDVLSEMYLMSCALKRFEDDGCPEEDLPLLHWSCRTSLRTIQERLDEILANFPSHAGAWCLRRVLFPWGMRQKPPSDRLSNRCADLLLSPSPTRDRLTAGIFIGDEDEAGMGRLEYAFRTAIAAEAAERKIKAAIEAGVIGKGGPDPVGDAVRSGVLTEDERRLMDEADRAMREAIAVDDFAPEELSGGGEPSRIKQTSAVPSIS